MSDFITNRLQHADDFLTKAVTEIGSAKIALRASLDVLANDPDEGSKSEPVMNALGRLDDALDDCTRALSAIDDAAEARQ